MFAAFRDLVQTGVQMLALLLSHGASAVGLVAIGHPRYRPIAPSDVLVPIEIYASILKIFPVVVVFVWYMEGFLWMLACSLGWALLMFLLGGWVASELLERSLARTIAAMTPNERMLYQAELRKPDGRKGPPKQGT